MTDIETLQTAFKYHLSRQEYEIKQLTKRVNELETQVLRLQTYNVKNEVKKIIGEE